MISEPHSCQNLTRLQTTWCDLWPVSTNDTSMKVWPLVNNMTGRNIWKSGLQGLCTATKLLQKFVGSCSNNKQVISTCAIEAYQHSIMLKTVDRLCKIWDRGLGGLRFFKQLPYADTKQNLLLFGALIHMKQTSGVSSCLGRHIQALQCSLPKMRYSGWRSQQES